MLPLLRPLFERWLLEASQAPLTAWKRSLLLSALERDEDLRRLALELAAFEHEEGVRDPAMPDLRPRLHAILASGEEALEKPLFPSAWIPAGALAAMLLVALLMSVLGHAPAPPSSQMAKAEDSQAAKDLALPSPTSSPTATVKAAPTEQPTTAP